jgi:hypothetical protein
MFGETYWSATGYARMENFMREKGISEEMITSIINEMDDVADEIRWQAKSDGAAEENYSQSMSYMND